MAEWITQTFETLLHGDTVCATLSSQSVTFYRHIGEHSNILFLDPSTASEARKLAMILRKASRRMDEIAAILPQSLPEVL